MWSLGNLFPPANLNLRQNCSLFLRLGLFGGISLRITAPMR